MPELPEVQAHAERLTAQFAGTKLKKFVPLTFTALKTALPRPDAAYGLPLESVGRRGKYLLLRFEPVTFIVHLMQGGRLLVDEKQSAKPRNGQARFVFADAPALLLTEAGTERRAGVWCIANGELDGPPLNRLGPEALDVTAQSLAESFETTNMRIHGYLRDQHEIAGLGRMLANEVCHRAKISPFAMTGKLGPDGAAAIVAAIHDAVEEGLAYERTRPDMSSSKDRPGRVHGRIGEPCPVCGDTIRSVSYSGYTVAYCPTCQTGGKILADNTTSKFLK
ncbi:MAG TPA: DNA-formamidopyrimidine glycosylase family protein [Ilumatobacteraceae bacterium]|nr:DNA-formamidopyrimidine glycosylase family protein [Ilumatobacteraceae bacterium]